MKTDIKNQFIVKEIFIHDVARAVEDEDLRKLVLDMGVELGENGRFLLRWYSAEPKIAVLIEALSMEECEAYLERFMTYLRDQGYLD
ncbi:MAG: hypothetical protein IJI04_09290 [Lachnospiraceae bacterium]|nr:hypothetical protein [Lachnospiraceae bacterium]